MVVINYLKGFTYFIVFERSSINSIFLENPEQVFSKEQIYSSVWGTGDVDANTIMVFINRLRSKLEENPKEPCYLRTVWGIGYTFTPDGCVQKK